jgi:hypothetical protein
MNRDYNLVTGLDDMLGVLGVPGVLAVAVVIIAGPAIRCCRPPLAALAVVPAFAAFGFARRWRRAGLVLQVGWALVVPHLLATGW